MQPAPKISKLLEEAVAHVSALPPGEQDAFARWLLAEVKAEKGWDERFAGEPAVLEGMADEALGELGAGRTEDLDLDGR